MYKKITGYCPTLKEEYSIDVKYLEISTLAFQGFIKDAFRCEYNNCSNCCAVHNCPIYTSATETL